MYFLSLGVKGLNIIMWYHIIYSLYMGVPCPPEIIFLGLSWLKIILILVIILSLSSFHFMAIHVSPGWIWHQHQHCPWPALPISKCYYTKLGRYRTELPEPTLDAEGAFLSLLQLSSKKHNVPEDFCWKSNQKTCRSTREWWRYSAWYPGPFVKWEKQEFTHYDGGLGWWFPDFIHCR